MASETTEVFFELQYFYDNKMSIANGKGDIFTKTLGNMLLVDYHEYEPEFLRSVRPFDLEIVTLDAPFSENLPESKINRYAMERYKMLRPAVIKQVEQILYSKNNNIKYARIFIGDESDLMMGVVLDRTGVKI